MEWIKISEKWPDCEKYVSFLYYDGENTFTAFMDDQCVIKRDYYECPDENCSHYAKDINGCRCSILIKKYHYWMPIPSISDQPERSKREDSSDGDAVL